jgi:DNA-binding MarR family transcriptional regulator
MALRNNVYDLKLELWHVLKPLEYYLVDVIIDKTIKWRTDEAIITISELKERTRQHHSEIYRALKNLESKGVIIRRKFKHDTVIGLNQNYFGALLIKRHEDALKARKNKIKIVIDNSKTVCETRTAFVRNSHSSCADPTQSMCESHTQNVSQPIEIIDGTPPLNTFFKDILIKTSLKEKKTNEENGESFTPLGKGPGRKTEQLKDPEKEKERQLRMLRLMEAN